LFVWSLQGFTVKNDMNIKRERNEEKAYYKTGKKTTVELRLHQARRQDLAAGGPKTRRRGQKPKGGATFLKCSIGCMRQPVGQT